MRFPISNSFFLRGLLILLATGLAAVSCSQQTALEGARQSIEPETAEFGTIQANDPVAFHSVSLILTNLGKERLEIGAIKLPEGFDYELVPRRNLDTGERTTLKITLDRRKFSGRVSETAYVLSNDTVQPRMPIALLADIVGDPTAPLPARNIGPDISIENKTYNFGILGRDAVIEHAFEVKNLGDKPLRFLGIESRCVCVAGRVTKLEVAPGDSAEIIVRLEAMKSPTREVAKTLTVFTNDPDEPSVPIMIFATIIDTARIEPETVHLPNVQLGQPASAEARLLQEGARNLKIKKIKTSSPRITVASSPLIGEQKGHLLTVTVGPDMPEGKFNESATVFTNYKNFESASKPGEPKKELHKDYSRLKLLIKGTVKGPVSVTPRTINFGSAYPGEPLRRKLALSSDTTSFEIKSLSITSPAFQVAWSPIEPGSKYEITVEFHPAGPERQVEEKLVITTTTGAELVVPVFASVKPGP